MPRSPQPSSGARDHVDWLIGQWAEIRPDVDVSGMHVVGRILRLAARIDAATQENFSRFGLAPGWFDLLATVRRAGRPLSPGALVDACMLTSGGMTGRIDRMERAGLVRRLPAPEDRRGVLVDLTDEGRDVVDRALVAHMEVVEGLIASLTPAEREALGGLLRGLLLDGA